LRFLQCEIHAGQRFIPAGKIGSAGISDAAGSIFEIVKTAWQAIERHWPEYLMEAAALGLFMVSACVFGVLLEHPGSALHQTIEDAVVRRAIGGIAMAATLIGLVYSPWGKRSGAHMNPAVTLSFYVLGKVAPWDAAFYVASQFTGGIAGVMISELLIGYPLRHSAVNYVVTVPGQDGPAVAFWAELLISAVMMGTVLSVSNSRRLSRFTGIFAGLLLAIYITIEAPFSGVSLNPARTVGSAYPAMQWTALWVYLTAPLLGMLTAAYAYRAFLGAKLVFCAKLHHNNHQRCIFRCNFGALHATK
jgi:aquaporin Z